MLTGDNDKNKIQRIKAFSKTQVHNSIGGFYATIKVNKTSVSRVNSNIAENVIWTKCQKLV